MSDSEFPHLGRSGEVFVQGYALARGPDIVPYVVRTIGGFPKEDINMSFRLLGAALFIASGIFAAGAQTSPPPSASPGASSTSGISAATHCRDSSGAVKL